MLDALGFHVTIYPYPGAAPEIRIIPVECSPQLGDYLIKQLGIESDFTDQVELREGNKPRAYIHLVEIGLPG